MSRVEGHSTQIDERSARVVQRHLPVIRRAWLRVEVWLPALLLFGAALWLRLYRLDAQPLWLDEGQTWAQVTRSRFSTLLIDLVRPSQAYPLFHLLLKFDTRLLGDSEWALRLPSALAGALAVPAIFALGRELRGWLPGIIAALLLLVSPFAIWQAQDAKAYSLVLLTTILLAWTLARALRLKTRRSWLIFSAVAVIAPFVHRLLLLTLIGCLVAWALLMPSRWRRAALIATVIAGAGLVAALMLAQDYQRAGGQFAWVGPAQAAWLTFGQFSVGQWPGAVRKVWLLPFAALSLIGAICVLRDLRRGQCGAIMIAALGGVPTLLFAILLAFRPFYETRYLTLVFPFWLLTLVWAVPPIRPAIAHDARLGPVRLRDPWLAGPALALLAWTLLVTNWALYLPGKGVFSGARVKEDYRAAVAELARRAHPDDQIIVHPDSILPLYDYYAPRVSTQPLPQPTTYGWLGRTENDQDRELRELDARIRADLRTKNRAWLLIAPDHAAVVDPPNRAAGDEVGLVGLAFQYGDREKRLQCNNPVFSKYVGVWLGCNNLPDVNGVVPQPQIALFAEFGDSLRLRGYSIEPFATGIRPGGTLPITLFWQPTASLAGTNYQVFVHLTQLDNPKPLAQVDGAPLEGGLPTSLWTLPGAELHDDRALALPPDLPPGRYALWLGVYRAEDGQRLPVTGTPNPVERDSLRLGEVEVQAR